MHIRKSSILRKMARTIFSIILFQMSISAKANMNQGGTIIASESIDMYEKKLH